MSDLETAAQQALEALEHLEDRTYIDDYGNHALLKGFEPEQIDAAITALRAALAEPGYALGKATTDIGVPVYVVKKAEPVQEPVAVPLAEWQINDLMADIDPEDLCSWSFRQGVYAAEKHHGIRS